MRKTLSILSSVSISVVATAAFAQPAGEPQPPPTPTPTPEPPPVTTPPPAPQTPTTPVPAEPKPETPAPEPSKKLAVGTKGLWNPGLLAQAWYQTERAGDNTQLSQFRLRRAEIALAGEILPKKVAFKVMFDAAKVRETTKVTVAGPPDAMGNPTTVTIQQPTSATSALQDFYITALSKYADASIGQFKIPVSWEGYNSSGKLIFPERAVVSNTLGDKRDLGLRIEKKFKQVGYSAGVFNGQGLNNFETNLQKDFALRLEVYPVPGLTLAGVTYDSVGQRDRAGTKDRWEIDARYETGPYLVQSEAIIARDKPMNGADFVTGRGLYVLAGYTLKDVDSELHGDLQPVVRVGTFDPNTDVDDNELLHFDVGVNYYIVKHEMKLQLAYQRTQFKDDAKPANNQLLLAAQVSY
jgi:hypothetical protein